MLIPTSNFLNIDVGKQTAETINSIKIDYSRMTFVAKTADQYTDCKSCGALLLQEDKHNAISKGNNGELIWTCRFCKKENSSPQLCFVNNHYKFAIQKNLKSKITPPIILFVIDNSGSMSQSIFTNIKNASNPQVISEAKRSLSAKFNDILLQSKLYEQEKRQISRIQKNFTTLYKNAKYAEEEISKLTFLYAMIEYNLNHLIKKDKKVDVRVGFIFFSDMIYVLKAAKQKEIPVYVQDGELCNEQWPYRKEIADFYQYQSLFKKGGNYQKYFGDSRLNSLYMSKVAIGKVKGGGRTALGPALALAMGIISVHDQGSRIIVVTDSMPNFGILSMGDSELIYGKIGSCLQQNGATLSILKWSGDQGTKSKEEDTFNEFRNKYMEYVDQIEIDLTKCKQSQALQMSIRSLTNLINKQPLGNSTKVKVYCDNPKIQVEKLANDMVNFKTLRFLSSNSKNWLSLRINRGILQELDYLFPVFTQIVITYDDLFSKERYIFMSYTKQQLLKAQGNQKSKDVELLQQEINIGNINELCQLQMLTKLQSMKRDEEYDANIRGVKTRFKYKSIEMEKDMLSINDIAEIKNSFYEESSRLSQYEQI